jgi:hypothetical protein
LLGPFAGDLSYLGRAVQPRVEFPADGHLHIPLESVERVELFDDEEE